MTSALSPRHAQRLEICYLSQINPDDGTAVKHGFSQSPKTLPPRYLYDERGSQLFEQICELPEYYPTRTEAAILANCVDELARLTGPCELIELGSGSSTKTRRLLDAYQALSPKLHYVPIDVSAEILVASARDLLDAYPSLFVRGLAGTYEQGLAQLGASSQAARLVLFLGSTLGNFAPAASDRFLAQLAAALAPGDYFLLGIDLRKDARILEAAYNDRQGITAAFNRNVLAHLNWRFQADFDLELFQHRAVYNRDAHQIEMYLDCQQACQVHLAALAWTAEFAAGESIRTEISRKFDLAALSQVLTQHQLVPLQHWQDAPQWFAVILCQRSAATASRDR
ncbi:MAG: L-histidine N(alpha)-methyltransferase [Spirulinaceae cyanobacterium RM2_2_10]|nr:L-histidine N(alpha)-methyltransferase [Spirulinaceae cyanobacterium SM2_1_0]NJO21098.1 L-histidine N(alpha)-methyltransferase [Spirulinaceae cyanobacterium RM2_2_10]